MRSCGESGPNHVVAPFAIGGHQMARVVTRPNATRLYASFAQASDDGYLLEEIFIEPGSLLAGVSVDELNRDSGIRAVVLTLIPPGGEPVDYPTPEQVMAAGSTILLVGQRGPMREVQRRAKARRR